MLMHLLALTLSQIPFTIKAEEARLYYEADAVWTISDKDKANMIHLVGKFYEKVNVDKKMFPVRYMGAPWDQRVGGLVSVHNVSKGFQERNGIIFVGPGNVPTNMAAIDWFLGLIWPQLIATLPSLQFTVVGGAWKKGRGKSVSDSVTSVVKEALKCQLDPPRVASTTCEGAKNILWAGRISQVLSFSSRQKITQDVSLLSPLSSPLLEMLTSRS